MDSFAQNRKSRPLVLGTPPSKEERRQRKQQSAYPSPPASQRRHGGPGVKEIEFGKKMEGHPNEIKTQYVATNLPKTKVSPPVETEEMRLLGIKKRKARDLELKKENKFVNINYLMDRAVNRLPSDEFMVVSPNIFWDGDDMATYYKWLNDEYYDGDMPEIVRRANAFRGFPQLDDEDFNPNGAAERRAYYRSEKGREELRPYLTAIKKYASKGEYVLIEAQVNGQTASDALDAATAAKGEPEAEHEKPYPLAAANYWYEFDNLSTRLDRSATLGRTPQDFESSPAFVTVPNPDGHSLENPLDPELEMIKDEPISSTVSGYLRAHRATYAKDEHEAAVEKEDDHSDEEVKDVDEGKDEDKDVNATGLSIALVPTPGPTPTKKRKSAGSKRMQSCDSTWEPSSAGGISSTTDDDEPLIKRVKQSHRGAARR